MAKEAALDLVTSDALFALGRTRRKQIPFAISLAGRLVAEDAADAVVDDLPRRFTIRNRFVERGVRWQKGTKADPTAYVFWEPRQRKRRAFVDQMVMQETGGIRRPLKRALALPRGIRRTKGGVISKRKRPAAVLQQKNTFIRPAAGGAVILRRRGKSRAPLLLYFLSRRSARIEERWRFVDTASDEARRVASKRFGQAFGKALRSAR